MRVIGLAALMALTAAACAGRSDVTTVGQRPACLHGDGETPAEADRRTDAVRWVRSLNTAEAVGSRGGAERYLSLEELTGLAAEPAGWSTQVTTDGETYLLAVKDTTDPCAFAYFSDQAGIIFPGAALQ